MHCTPAGALSEAALASRRSPCPAVFRLFHVSLREPAGVQSTAFRLFRRFFRNRDPPGRIQQFNLGRRGFGLCRSEPLSVRLNRRRRPGGGMQAALKVDSRNMPDFLRTSQFRATAKRKSQTSPGSSTCVGSSSRAGLEPLTIRARHPRPRGTDRPARRSSKSQAVDPSPLTHLSAHDLHTGDRLVVSLQHPPRATTPRTPRSGT